MSTIYRPDEFDILSSHQRRLDLLESGCPSFIVPPSSDLKGGWDHAANTDPQFEFWGYRICDGQLEFKGHLMPGTSGVVVYTLPPDFRIYDGNPTWPTDIATGVNSWTFARIIIDMTSGDITIVFPAI